LQSRHGLRSPGARGLSRGVGRSGRLACPRRALPFGLGRPPAGHGMTRHGEKRVWAGTLPPGGPCVPAAGRPRS
jgi:hypothetical protein